MSETPPLGSPAGSTDEPRRAPTGQPSSGLARWSNRWLALALGIAAVALAYGVGRFQGAMALSAEEERGAKEGQSARARLDACDEDRQLLEARRSLALAALSLDRRNFGVAESHRQAALQMLERPAVTGLTKVAEVATTIRTLDLAVNPNPGAQRESVIAAGEALDDVLTARAKPLGGR